MIYRSARFILITIFVCLIYTGCNEQPELIWNEEDGYRWAELTINSSDDMGFEELSSSRTNVDFSTNVSDQMISENRNYANGSGVAIGDVDGDNLPDIYFASTSGSNRLYKNLGNFEFQDITEEAGVAHEGFSSTGVVFADLNGDSYKDLLITSLSDGNSVYLNDGTGKFSYQEDSGLGASNGSHSMALADINNDGYLDLYIANYRSVSVRDLYGPEDLSLENTTRSVDGKMEILPEFEEFYKVIEIDGQQFRQETGAPDGLYLNNGDGSFKKADLETHFPVNAEGKAGLFKDWGFTPIFKDITGNGLPDLYVTNDFWTPDRLWINQGDGTFHAAKENAIVNQSFSSMGVDVADIDKNGEMDIVVSEMLSGDHPLRLRQFSDYMGEYQGATHHNHNSMYLNRGDSTFAQINYLAGLEATGWSWATKFLDADIDGHEDLIVATGFYRDYLDMDAQREINARYSQMGEEMMQQGTEFLSFPELKSSNKAFFNNGDLTFSDVSSRWGFTSDDISMGMAIGDLNNDGAPDLVFNRFNETASIYKNKASNPRIAVRLKGKVPNSDAIGSKVSLIGGPITQEKEISSGGIYLSGSDYLLTFAASENSESHTIEITWRDGTRSRIENVSANRIYEIDQATIATEPILNETEEPSPPLFRDISDAINHTHHESSYNDFQRVQPLLPKELSRKGPAVAWMDVNNDSLDDLIITEGKGGALQIFENRGNSSFRPFATSDFVTAAGDQVSIAGWQTEEGASLVVGSSNYEQGDPNVPSAFIHTFRDGLLAESQEIPGVLSSTGPIAAADYDGNGSVDLYVGGHFLPGGYPRDASSRLFKAENGKYQIDQLNSRALSQLGLVNAAVFDDFTQNGAPDLLVSTEWGTLKLLENRDGRFFDISSSSGLNNLHGWWNGIASGDFNNDGLIDFVALNIGTNSPYKMTGDRALRLYYGDLNLNNRLDIVDSYYHAPSGGYVPRRKLLDFRSIPTILRNVRSHEEFSVATVGEIFNMDFSQVPYKEISSVKHLVFLNTGEGFDVRELPIEAQMSTGYHAGVADVNNDGNEDLFISQNSFEYPSSVAKQDAGRGLILLGDGTGSFKSISGSESGIKMYGEQRGAAFSDFNADGRTDLAVGQNGGATKLYLNQTASQGVTVKLQGPDQNRSAIGSGIRIVYKDGTLGPLRTIQAGSGYRSLNSTSQVLGLAGEPEAIEIRWFDGVTSNVAFTPEKMRYTITYSDRSN